LYDISKQQIFFVSKFANKKLPTQVNYCLQICQQKYFVLKLFSLANLPTFFALKCMRVFMSGLGLAGLLAVCLGWAGLGLAGLLAVCLSSFSEAVQVAN